MKTHSRALAAVAALAFFLASAAGDTIRMKNGDVVTGKVLTLEKGVVKVETPYMGEVKVDLKEVESIVTEEPVSAVIQDGARLFGKLIYDAAAGVVVETPDGPVSVDASRLEGIAPAPPPAPPVVTPKWTGSVEIGLSGQSGNRETFTGNARLNARRRYERTLLEAYASARYGLTDGVRSANQQRAGGRVECDINEKWFSFVGLELERDEFRNLDFRSTASLGLGYTWWQEGSSWWKTSAGLGATYETYSDAGSDTFPIAQLTSDYSKAFNASVTFSDITRVTFDLTDANEFRVENDAALVFPLDIHGTWQLRLGVNHQYDNRPEPGISSLDTFYYLNAIKTF